jgi:ABC-type nitrate/sulfonate/bicarbonate transport system permease component
VSRSARLLALEIICPIVLVVIIWFWTQAANSFFFPPLSAIMTAFAKLWMGPALINDAVPSLARWGVAYVIAVVLGIAIGIPMGLSRTARDLFGPIIEFVRTTPPPAILPIAVILLGIGDLMKVSMIVLVCVFPILLSTADGVAEVHQTYRDVAKAYRIPFVSELFLILLPAAGPRIFAGLRTSCTLALVLIVLSEMFGSTNGIGYRILASLRSFAIPEMWSGVILLGLLGYAVDLGFGWGERRLLRWHQVASHD